MERKRNFDALIGLRGIFCILIMLFHTLPITPLTEQIPLSSFIKIYGGNFGNYMFFMLSGFLMTYGYRDRIQAHEISAKEFLLKRICKIYPLYIISNFAMFVHELLAYGISGFNLKRIVFTILLQSGGGLDAEYPYNGPGWFISALLVCYLLFYFMVYHAKHRTQYYCMIAFGVIWGYSIVVNDGPIFPICFAYNGESIMTFFIGCILAEVYPIIDSNVRKWLLPASFFMVTISAILAMKYGVEIICGDSRIAFSFAFCPLILYLALDSSWMRWFLMWRPVQYLGKISFSIYLWHSVINRFFRYVYMDVMGFQEIQEQQYLLYVCIVMLVSILSHKFIENKRSV